MFQVVFEVLPHKTTYEDYLHNAKMLRPELERIDGFVDNIRYKSLTRDGWIVSLSSWRDEKSLVRWRTHARHHLVQEEGRNRIFEDYNLRIGQVTDDSNVPLGYTIVDQRLDTTETGLGKTLSVITATRPSEWQETKNPYDCAEWLGLNPRAAAEMAWDIYESILPPADLLLIISWADDEAALAYENSALIPQKARVRRIRVVRDYGKYDRREAPQFYPEFKQETGAA